MFFTAKDIRRRKHSGLRRIRLQITVGKSCSDSLMDWTISLSLFVVVFSFSFFFFFAPVLVISKKTLVISRPSPSPLIWLSILYLCQWAGTRLGCHMAHKLKPKFGTFGTCSSIPSSGRGRSARQSVFITPPSVPRRDICPPRVEIIWKRRCCERTPAVRFRSWCVTFLTTRHGASRGCACLSRVS